MLKGKFLAAWVVVLASVAVSPAFSATLDVPGRYSSIADALANANPGDTVKVAPGRYHENGLVLPAGIILAGDGDHPDETIIDGQGRGRILTASFTESVSFIQNLTFTNGWARLGEGYDDCGGALYINSSLVRVFNCRFMDNRADADGGAVSCMNAAPLFINCQFENNRAGEGGGALDCSYDASPIVQNSFFRRNSAAYGGAVSARGNSFPMFNVCHFDRNLAEGDLALGGGAFSFYWGRPTFTQCTFSRNTAEKGGGVYSDIHSPVKLTACTVAMNVAYSLGGGILSNNNNSEIKSSIIAFQEGIGVFCLGADLLPRISCSNIFGNSGGDWYGAIAPQAAQEGNLSEDPLFCSANLDDTYMFNLQDDSPCTLDAGACADMGAWPVGCNTPMETLVSLVSFTVIWIDGVPVIAWQVDGNRGPISFRLARTSLQDPDSEEDIPYTIGHSGEFLAQDSGFIPDPDQTYLYRLYLVLDSGGEFLLGTIPLGNPPRVLTISNASAWPNPFNPRTRVHFELAASQEVKVDVYGIDGRRVRSLASRTMPAGPVDLVWNGRDDGGRAMASGPYVVIVAGQEDTRRIKVTLLK